MYQEEGLVPSADLPRARFHEISKPAVTQALASLTSIDEHMVEAYFARRCVCWVVVVVSALPRAHCHECIAKSARGCTRISAWTC